MRKYVLFCGNNYYPKGGWQDFGGYFDSLIDAVEKGAKYDWYHVIVVETGEIIRRGNWHTT